MDSPSMLYVAIPPLSDEAVEEIQNFLEDLLCAFKAHYVHERQRHSRGASVKNKTPDSF